MKHSIAREVETITAKSYTAAKQASDQLLDSNEQRLAQLYDENQAVEARRRALEHALTMLRQDVQIAELDFEIAENVDRSSVTSRPGAPAVPILILKFSLLQ